MSSDGSAPFAIKNRDALISFLDKNQDKISVVVFNEDWSANGSSTYGTIVEETNKNAGTEIVAIGEIAAESVPELCQEYKIVGVPTIIFFENRKEKNRVTGVRIREFTDTLNRMVLTMNSGVSMPVVEPATGQRQTAVARETVNIDERIKELINQSDIMVFIKGTPKEPRCGFSRTIVGILNEIGVKYGSFDILEDEGIRQGLKTYSNWQTYPQLYAKGELIGGLDIVKEMKESGDLMSALTESS